jgi:hypothetical protein
MTNKTYLFIAAVCGSIAAVANQFAAEGESAPITPAPEGASGEPEKTDTKPRRGRPAKTEAPAEPETPAPTTPEPTKSEPTGGTKEYSDEDLRKAAEGLIKGGFGLDVKKLIVTHGGSDKLATVPAAARAAFVRDLEAMDM